MVSDHQTNEMAMNEKSVCSFSIFWPFFSRLQLVTASLRLSLLPIDQARFWVNDRHVVKHFIKVFSFFKWARYDLIFLQKNTIVTIKSMNLPKVFPLQTINLQLHHEGAKESSKKLKTTKCFTYEMPFSNENRVTHASHTFSTNSNYINVPKILQVVVNVLDCDM